MRTLIGILVLGLGYLFLGFVGTGKVLSTWNFGKDTKEIETFVAEGAQSRIPETASLIETTVSGRDITASGMAQTQAEKDAILMALDDVEGRRVVVDKITLMNIASPYAFRSEKTADGTIVYSGNTPRKDTFSGAISSSDLSLASGMPDAQWPDVVNKSYGSMAVLQTGALDINDREITLTGLAPNLQTRANVEELFANLPDGYNATLNIDVVPTQPYIFSGQKTVDGLAYQGLVPDAQSVATFQDMLGVDAQLTPAFGMPDENWPTLVDNGAKALAQLTVGDMKLIDKELTITGEAADLGIANAIKSTFNTLPDGYRANIDLTVKPLDQYTFRGNKQADDIQYAGFIPDETARESLSTFIGDQAETLQLAAGMPDEDWPAFVGKGVSALQGLENGELDITDRKLILTGTVANPNAADDVAAIIGKVPEGYDVELHLTALDDGRPAQVEIDYSIASGATVSGKAPNGLSDENIAGALGLASISGGIVPSRLDGNDAINARLSAIGRWVPSFESANAIVQTNATQLSAVLLPGQACRLEETKTEMSATFGENADITLQPSPDEPANGTERVNGDTGKAEIYQNCFWLVKPEEPKPVVIPEPEVVEEKPQPVDTPVVTIATCESRIATLMQGTRINFVTAKADLDPGSIALIDDLASAVQNCVNDGFRLEIGGHTDSRGSAEYNAQLSLERAAAVVSAFVDRGINASALTAKGYGETSPIASNETEEGQALNRRTSFTWNKN